MADDIRRDDLFRSLSAFGSDLAKWPAAQAAAARPALLGDAEFRRVWEAERDLDRLLHAQGMEDDERIAATGALDRVKAGALQRLPMRASLPMSWRRIAAAMVMAGVLGGAMDVYLIERQDLADIVALDPLLGLDDTSLQ